MTNQIRSSRRQIKLPGKYNDHIMGIPVKEMFSPELGKQEDKHEDMDKNGVDQENNIGVKKVMGNNELNGARKDQYGKMDLNEKSANIQVNSNANCSNNCVIIDNEGEEGDKSNGNNHKSVTYAKMVGQDEVPKTLSYIPTLTTDDGVEVVVFDEMLVKKGSERWNVTICGQFVGFQMHISEMRYNIRRMWSKFGVTEINTGKNGSYMFKFRDEEGLNRVLEKGPWMVKNKSLMVNRWSPNIGKVFKTEIEVQYRDNENMVKGVKKVQVLYDWKPPVCSKCKVFGHNGKYCKDNNEVKSDNDTSKGGEGSNARMEANKQDNTEFVMQGKRGKVNNANRCSYNNWNNPSRTKNRSYQGQQHEWKNVPSFRKQAYRRKNPDDNSNMDANNENQKTKSAADKRWPLKDTEMGELRKSANKYSLLDSLPEDDDQEIRILKDRMIVDLFLNKKIQPSLSESKTWSKDMIKYFKEKWDEDRNKERHEQNVDVDLDDVVEETNGMWNIRGSERRNLWKNLEIDRRFANGRPWCIAGDMNVTRHTKEHSSGSSLLTANMMEFIDCINRIEVDDVCSSGLFYTWTKNLHKAKTGVLTGVLKKLDREFLPTVKEQWGKEIGGCYMYKVVKKLKDLKFHLNKLGWNKGNLFKRVNELRVRLQNVQTQIDKDPHNGQLRNMGVSLLEEFLEAEADEEKFLFQQAKIKWLSEGDRNSKFFHKVLKGRNHTSRITTICDNSGKIYEGDQVNQVFLKHFEDFLGKSHNVLDIDISKNLFQRNLSVAEADHMEFFTTGKLLGELNATLTSLILKVHNPSKFTEFRPIACCNVLYKCISKIITNRIKPYLGCLVSYNQSNFIPGRHIQDNILITQELMKGYNRKNGPQRVAMKIDIQKAYDTVNWNFLKKALEEFGFHEKMVLWIMQCVTTTKFTLCINGERVGYFKGGRGLRQGDPISPYLFTLIMEVFTLVMQRQIDREKGFQYHLDAKISSYLMSALQMICWFYAMGILLLLDVRSAIQQILPFEIGKLPVRYLGVPLIAKRLGVKECSSLLEKINNRINNWKNKSLSYAGRLQLISAVLESIHNQGESTKGKANVTWDNVYRPKSKGGLGLKDLHVWNYDTLRRGLDGIRVRGRDVITIQTQSNKERPLIMDV
ncbi:RNA-directed DNA polymerase, eukaryota, reverse transcriptase zinc-binding domain protein [Tanacetum coccineum]|uniref:RNA-directed DNA polymerase, eukaryota, reverse transcriptase zinc-binding domain protein n=1 Tax=Tanacetum coccineum TaxID=301880 RepID=A0ABQ5ADR2_9ASTR